MDKGKVIKKAAEELLGNLQIEATVDVVPVEEVYQVNVQTEESGLLIGYHGETLSSFQLILGLMTYKKLGEWIKIIVEVGDYRAKKMESLAALAVSYADRAIAENSPIALAPMSPFERRAVHMALSDRTDVEAISEGEGDMRHIVIRPTGS
ncbi:hypothetical protein A2872_00865 [Candidatus Gottesmanbacteria bacterium RIFCSPHIGHO2_01_FULL_42_12]|uniref:R3H domain-containing protein n=1 Tax=Candidatus Gottesmanbacteria bacterium RIFCSPHIGHO2_01_FULL_42_12 TaxID=1798377 RepID=A0A1F5Z2T2_9BACT|nr:MAG: hypothetical protein A2872_00865 [Candidatus Gottesmanbacteria bacterium RIFCSPHIGHO2_01_FULL_42_12]